MRNLWVAGRALTSACTYLAHMKPVLDGSPGRGMRARLGPARPVTVPVDPGKGHRVHNTRPRTCPRSRDTRSAPRRPAGAHREARDRAGSRSARPGCGLGTPERHPRPPQRRPQRRTMRGRPATHLSRGRAGCPPGPRLPGALWDRDSGMPATGKGTGRVRVTGAWRAPGLVGLWRETVACRRAASYRRAPVSAAARPLPRASPARKARGRAELPRAAPAPARPLAQARAAHRRSSSWGSAPSPRGPQG